MTVFLLAQPDTGIMVILAGFFPEPEPIGECHVF
jgi:hypothetical protein